MKSCADLYDQLVRAIEDERFQQAKQLAKNIRLYQAVEKDDTKSIASCLENGANVNTLADNDECILMIAVKKGCSGVVEQLLAAGAVQTADKYGRTPLMFASAEGTICIIDALLKAGANIDARDDRGWTALMCASRVSNYAVTSHLLGRGANRRIKNNDGWTAREIRLLNEDPLQRRPYFC